MICDHCLHYRRSYIVRPYRTAVSQTIPDVHFCPVVILFPPLPVSPILPLPALSFLPNDLNFWQSYGGLALSASLGSRGPYTKQLHKAALINQNNSRWLENGHLEYTPLLLPQPPLSISPWRGMFQGEFHCGGGEMLTRACSHPPRTAHGEGGRRGFRCTWHDDVPGHVTCYSHVLTPIARLRSLWWIWEVTNNWRVCLGLCVWVK